MLLGGGGVVAYLRVWLIKPVLNPLPNVHFPPSPRSSLLKTRGRFSKFAALTFLRLNLCSNSRHLQEFIHFCRLKLRGKICRQLPKYQCLRPLNSGGMDRDQTSDLLMIGSGQQPLHWMTTGDQNNCHLNWQHFYLLEKLVQIDVYTFIVTWQWVSLSTDLSWKGFLLQANNTLNYAGHFGVSQHHYKPL